MIFVFIFLLFIFSFALIKSAEMVVISLKRISRKTKTGAFALSAIVIALGTSLPELFVGITAALEGTPTLSLGNVIGANIANISLVAGISAIFVKSINISNKFFKKDVAIAAISSFAPLLLILDKRLDRIDGLILLSIYGLYATSLFKARYREIALSHIDEDYFHRLIRRIPILDGHQRQNYARLFLGIATLLMSADVIVKLAELIAQASDAPLFLIGLIVISLGTTLPELAFSFKSLKDHEPSMFLGNLLGSIIANSTFILGIVALIQPIEITFLNDYLLASFSFSFIFLVFWYFIKSNHKLVRLEAAFLILLYLTFVFLIRAN
jgi:cation:H+ antiporter